ncbi:MAG: KR domain-containing protein, partial [Bacteroidota bacterium]
MSTYARLLGSELIQGGRVLVCVPPAGKRTSAQAGWVGYVNTLAVEWPKAVCRTLELDGCKQRAACILEELLKDDSHSHVMVASGERFALHAQPAPVFESCARQVLTAEDVVWLTGGARGITASIAAHLARERGCRLFLSGRSPEPSAEEAFETRGFETVTELQAHFISTGSYHSAREIKQAVEKCLRDREIRNTLSTIRGLGVSCTYLQGDVSDEASVREHIQTILDQ